MNSFRSFPRFMADLLRRRNFPMGQFRPIRYPRSIVIVRLTMIIRPRTISQQFILVQRQEKCFQGISVIIQKRTIPITIIRIHRGPFNRNVSPNLCQANQIVAIRVLRRINRHLRMIILSILLIVNVFSAGTMCRVLIQRRVFSRGFHPLSHKFIFELRGHGGRVFLFRISAS